MRVWIALFAATAALLAASGAQASCTATALGGQWTAQAPTADFDRLTIEHHCEKNGTTLEFWTSCAPQHCNSGRLAAETLRSGWTYSLLDEGYAQRHIFLRLTEPGRLQVFIKTDFSDPARHDFDRDAVFVKG